MRRYLSSLALAGAIVALWGIRPADAQQQPSDKTQEDQAKDSLIIVEGQGRADAKPPMRIDSDPGPGFVLTSSAVMADARMLARCAFRRSPQMIHDVVDGLPNKSTTTWALDRLIRQNATCYLAYNPGQNTDQTRPVYGECNPIAVPGSGLRLCRSFYDRAALLEYTLQTYLPDLNLTPADLRDPSVRARYLARERPRAKIRFAADRRYFAVASCIVQTTPAITTQFLHSAPGSNAETELRDDLLKSSRACVQNARKVTVDPIQFRMYMLEAVYAWTLAIQAKSSLLPLEATVGR